jgi:hypothetical protein
VEQAVALAEASGDRDALAIALTSKGLLQTFGGMRMTGDLTTLARQVVALTEEVGRWSQAAYTAAGIAMYESQRSPAVADAWLERSSADARRSGNPSAIAFAALANGRVIGFRGDLEAARPWFDEAREAFHRIGDVRLELSARSDLAHALRLGGALGEAEAEYREVIVAWQHLGQRGAVARLLECFAFLAIERDDQARAATLLGAAERLREVASATMIPPERQEYEAAVGRLRARFDPDRLDRAWAAGRELAMDDAVALARAG